jgi:hypothetical protein
MLPAAYDITDKVVFITGAGRGIGKGIAQVLAKAGADVAINALTPRYVEPTAAELADATGRRVIPVIADQEFSLLANDDIDGVGIGRCLDGKRWLAARPGIGRIGMLITQVVAMHMTEEHRMDCAEPWIIRASHGATGIVQNPRAVGVFEDERPV